MGEPHFLVYRLYSYSASSAGPIFFSCAKCEPLTPAKNPECLGLRTPLPVVAFWVYLPGPNDTHSRIAVLFTVHRLRFNRLSDPKKSPNGRGVL
jgi:hypothetical protein